MALGEFFVSYGFASLMVQLATPIAVVILGRHLAAKIGAAQWRNRTTVEWRMRVFDRVARPLNDLLCYYLYVGNWKDLTPREILERKRLIDKEIYTAAPLFSSEVVRAYRAFMSACFVEFSSTHGEDARLRTDLERHRVALSQWNEDWNRLFVTADAVPDREEVAMTFDALMTRLTRHLDLELEPTRVGALALEGERRARAATGTPMPR